MNPIKIRYQLRNVRWTLIVTQLACLEPQNMFQEMAFSSSSLIGKAAYYVFKKWRFSKDFPSFVSKMALFFKRQDTIFFKKWRL